MEAVTMGHRENESFTDRVKGALGFGDRDAAAESDLDHENRVIDEPGDPLAPEHAVTRTGTVVEEHHHANPHVGGDAPIHGDLGASDVEANANRPAGPDYGAEDTLVGGGHDPLAEERDEELR